MGGEGVLPPPQLGDNLYLFLSLIAKEAGPRG